MGNKRNRAKKYDRIRDDSKKGRTKRNQKQLVDVEEDPVDVEDDATEATKEIGTSQGTNFSSILRNLMEMNEDSLFSHISFKHMVPESTIKLHCKNMWEEYFEKKSMVERAQLFVKLCFGVVGCR